MTNNFLCIPNECTRIKYQAYKKSGGVRYRYPGQEWRLVDGDRYTIEPERGACKGSPYGFQFNASVIDQHGNPGFLSEQFETEVPGGENSFAPGAFLGEITSISQPPTVYLSHPYPNGELRYFRANIDFVDRFGISKTAYAVPSRSLDGWKPGSIRNVVLNFAVIGGHTRTDDCGDCVFTVYKNDEIIFQKIDPVCPEAENLESYCEKSDRTEQIKIEKLPYLQRIEIRDQSIDPIYVSPLAAPLLDTNPLPGECLNIYKTYVAAPPFLSNYVPLPGFINPYEFVAQICSAPGCPPPKYEVICDCGESCPDGTCATSCGDVVCCHDSTTGIAVHQIPIEDYVGGQS